MLHVRSTKQLRADLRSAQGRGTTASKTCGVCEASSESRRARVLGKTEAAEAQLGGGDRRESRPLIKGAAELGPLEAARLAAQYGVNIFVAVVFDDDWGPLLDEADRLGLLTPDSSFFPLLTSLVLLIPSVTPE